MDSVNKSIFFPKNVCEKHPRNGITMYCDRCDEAMCTDCVQTIHRAHNTKSLDMKATEIMENYSASSNLRDKEKYEGYLREIQRIKEHNDLQETNAMSELEKRKQTLLKWIEKAYCEQRKICQKRFSDVAQKLSKSEEILHEKLKYADFLSNAKTLSSSAYEIVQTTKTFISKQADFSQKTLELTRVTVEFNGTQITPKDVQKHFEIRFHSQDAASPRHKPLINRIQSNDITSSFAFSNKKRKIVDITPVTEQTAWIHRQDSRTLLSMTDKGKRVQEVRLRASDIDGLIVNDNSIVYSEYKKMCIWETSIQGETRSLCSTEPFHPYGLCRLQEGGYLVCLNEHDPSDDVNKQTMKSKCCISKLFENGELKEMAFYNRKTTQNYEMIFPYRVAQSRHDSLIAFVDINVEDDTGVVALADNNGDIIDIYSGSSDENFDPICSCFDDQSMLLISDYGNSKIHILNTEGNCTQILTMVNPKLNPYCIAVCDEKLWIGDDNDHVYICSYKK